MALSEPLMISDQSVNSDGLAPAVANAPAVRVVVTGATGYVGGRLVPRLLEAGYAVRCIVRAPAKLRDKEWFSHPRLEVVQGDPSDVAQLRGQLAGCGPAYYLIHSMVAAGPEY